ncbi:hypothetical protein [Bacillus rubiinfantis]|uniref:hypothetical protein n=1 Tax=Bacillus rubiinfantis TaxID=1499680 RepID=UPI0005AB2A77|nr:hypothetical protein [Bacillus rubiinfantis]
MTTKRKEQVKMLLIIIMTASLLGAFILFFLQQYTLAFGSAGVFMALASFLSQWTAGKSHDYVYRKTYKDRYR